MPILCPPLGTVGNCCLIAILIRVIVQGVDVEGTYWIGGHTLEIFAEHESSFIDASGGERHLDLSILSYLGRLNNFLVQKMNLSNRTSQVKYHCELSLDLSQGFGTDVNVLVSLAKEQDDKMMEALHEQDLDAERCQREMIRLEETSAVLKRRENGLMEYKHPNPPSCLRHLTTWRNELYLKVAPRAAKQVRTMRVWLLESIGTFK